MHQHCVPEFSHGDKGFDNESTLCLHPTAAPTPNPSPGALLHCIRQQIVELPCGRREVKFSLVAEEVKEGNSEEKWRSWCSARQLQRGGSASFPAGIVGSGGRAGRGQAGDSQKYTKNHDLYVATLLPTPGNASAGKCLSNLLFQQHSGEEGKQIQI